MNTQSVIIRAILTEKAHMLMAKGIYTFLVAGSSTKDDVKKAVHASFSVDPVNVNITSIKAKLKRIAKTRKFTTVGGGKKAVVYLKAGQTIAALQPKVESKDKKVKTKSSEKDVQKIQVEGREGA